MNTNLQKNCSTHFNKNTVRKLTFIQKIKLFFYKNKWSKSDKYCPRCGNEYLGRMSSLQLKYCPECHFWFPWKLKYNQKRVI